MSISEVEQKAKKSKRRERKKKNFSSIVNRWPRPRLHLLQNFSPGGAKTCRQTMGQIVVAKHPVDKKTVFFKIFKFYRQNVLKKANIFQSNILQHCCRVFYFE
jgi:hypothetical protein